MVRGTGNGAAGWCGWSVASGIITALTIGHRTSTRIGQPPPLHASGGVAPGPPQPPPCSRTDGLHSSQPVDFNSLY